MSDPQHDIDARGGETWPDDVSGYHRVSDGGSRHDYYDGETHSWGSYNQEGDWTGGGVGETHPHHNPYDS